MATDNKEELTFWERLQDTYRLVVMNDETFEEMGSYRLTRLNVYLFFSSVVVVTAILIVLLIIFTPLKEWIPGYGDVNLRDKVEAQAQHLQSLEERYLADSIYVANVRRLLVTDFETVEAMPDTTNWIQDTTLEVAPILEEEELRTAVEKNQPLIPTKNITEEIQPAKFSPNKNKPLEQLYFISPVNGEVSSGFMPDKKHYGVDIMAPRNTPIKAIMSGIIIQSDWTLETGNTVTIQHNNNLVSFYKHNSALLKKVGDTVNAGEAIAIIGNTGTMSSGPHLHLELWHNGRPIDPSDYISFH